MTDRTDRLAPIIAALSAAGCVRARDEAELISQTAGHSPDRVASLVARRVAGEPLEHVVGWAWFAGVRVQVAPGVFVPRHRSEHLVAVAATWLANRPATRPEPGATRPEPGATVVDLCAGTGALGRALYERSGPFRLVATDLDPRAVACAAANLAPIGGTSARGDLFDALDPLLRGRIDLAISSPPYVPTDAMALLPREAREHEGALALDGGPDGLAVLRRLVARAPDWLAPGGALMVELSAAQTDLPLPQRPGWSGSVVGVASGPTQARSDDPAVLVYRQR